MFDFVSRTFFQEYFRKFQNIRNRLKPRQNIQLLPLCAAAKMSHDLNKKCGVCVTVADIEYLNEILSHRLSILYHFENSIWPYIVKILYKLFYTISIYKHFEMGMTYFSLVHCLNYLHSYKKNGLWAHFPQSHQFCIKYLRTEQYHIKGFQIS